MSETIAILSMAFLCGTGILLTKFCRLRTTVEQELSQQYILITKEYYETLKTAQVINVQPPLPDYSEKGPLLGDLLEN